MTAIGIRSWIRLTSSVAVAVMMVNEVSQASGLPSGLEPSRQNWFKAGRGEQLAGFGGCVDGKRLVQRLAELADLLGWEPVVEAVDGSAAVAT